MKASEPEIGEIVRPPKEVVEGLGKIATSTLTSVLDDLGLHDGVIDIKPVAPGLRFAGPAFTVKEVTGPFGTYTSADLRLASIMEMAEPGDVVVIDNDGNAVSTWGGVASFAAQKHGIAGLLCDGGVRDVDEIAERRFAAFSRHVTPLSGRARIKIVGFNGVVRIDGVKVRPGDVVVGDGSGVVCIPGEVAADVLERAQAFERRDQQTVEQISRGDRVTIVHADPGTER